MNVKLFNNGKIQITGLKKPTQGIDLINTLLDYFKDIDMIDNDLHIVTHELVLINSDYKRLPWFIVMAGVVILIGHYVDIFVMIMPATVVDRWFFGLPEISALALFSGLFMLIVFYSLSKAPLLAKGNPYIKESENFHY